MVASRYMSLRVPVHLREESRRYTITLKFKRIITHDETVRIRNSILAVARRQHRRIPNVEFEMPET